jgi:hypothetical protein
MRCGKTEQLVQWAVEAITQNPDEAIVVAASAPEEGHDLMTRIRDRLRSDHAEQTKDWKFTLWRIRTPEHGHIELFASRRDRVVRGYRVDKFLASDRCEPSVIETGKWTEYPNGRAD